MTRLRLIAAAALALVLVLPSTAMAATYGVSGTVTDKDGAPVAGAEVTALVEGSDEIRSTTSDASGAWAIEVDADAGAIVDVNGTGPEVSTDPDENGCETTTTASGASTVTLPTDGRPDLVALVLDKEVSGTVCSATAPPDATHAPKAPKASRAPTGPGLTPPATDTVPRSTGSTAGSGTLLLLAGLATFILITVGLIAPRAPRRR